MSTFNLLIVNFPTAQDSLIHWWHVIDGVKQASGCDSDPLLAAGLKRPAVEAEPLEVAALVPSASTVIAWHERAEDLTDQQALAAARLAVRDQSLNPETLHVAAAVAPSDQIVTAAIGSDILASGLHRLQDIDLDPDLVVPCGLLLDPRDDGFAAADFSFDRVLRGDRLIVPDEPGLRETLVADHPVVTLTDSEAEQTLCTIETSGALNLRTGDFVKKIDRSFSAPQKRLLAGLLVALLLVSLLIPLVSLAKYHWATNQVSSDALAKASAVVGPASSLEDAEKLLDQRLISENRGNVMFSVPASALFAAVQQAPGVSIERIGYRSDGTVSAGLSAVRNEDINPALLALQRAGFVITATPRTDATGSAKADITVRAP